MAARNQSQLNLSIMLPCISVLLNLFRSGTCQNYTDNQIPKNEQTTSYKNTTNDSSTKDMLSPTTFDN